MQTLTASVDKNADLKALKKVEVSGLVELFAVAIEGFEDTGKIPNKALPIGVIGSKFGLIGSCVIAADDNKYHAIQKIVDRQNHGDCLHLQRHIESGRDVFVTDDNDFLSCRDQLAEAFGVTILTVVELVKRVGGSASGDATR